MEWAQIILRNCVPSGVTIEIGASNAVTKEIFEKVNALGLDPIFLKTLALQADATHLPFATNSVSNFISTDTFHHLPDAELFLGEISRVLIPGGRLILIEPWNNWWAKFIYRRFHPEPFLTNADWTTIGDGPMTRANGALPWIVFSRDYCRFMTSFPELGNVKIEQLMPISFLLSGGARSRFGTPGFLYRPIRKLERVVDRFQWGLSALIVVEKLDIYVEGLANGLNPKAPTQPLNEWDSFDCKCELKSQ